MTQPIQILLVEDNPGDADLIRDTMLAEKVQVHIVTIADGVEALAYLSHGEPYVQAERPDLILLDINLPGLSGRDLLKRIKSDRALREIPTVMLTSSDNAHDVSDCYALGANCYLTKPIGLVEFQTVVQSIESFWLTVVKLPEHGSPR